MNLGGIFKMFKRLSIAIAVILVAAMGIGCVAFLGGCSKDEATRMTVDINPSIEFMLDGDNKVVSVSGLNDDGALIIYGEAFIGKSAEDAVELAVSIAYDAGYLTEGSVSGETENIEISVSGSSSAASKLYKKVSGKVSSFVSKNNISAAVVQIDALKTDALIALAMKCDCTLTEEEAEKMTEAELLSVIEAARKETQDILSAEMKDAYYAAKAYRLQLAENEAVKTVIDGLSSTSTEAISAYDALVTSLQTAIQKVENARYNYFIDPSSEYQKAVSNMLEKKSEYFTQREAVLALTDSLEKQVALGILTVKETALTAAQLAVTTSGTAANAAIDIAVATLNAAYTSLVSARESFPAEIKTALTDNAKKIDSSVNEEKDKFFEVFEKEYETQLAAYNKMISEYKNELTGKAE